MPPRRECIGADGTQRKSLGQARHASPLHALLPVPECAPQHARALQLQHRERERALRPTRPARTQDRLPARSKRGELFVPKLCLEKHIAPVAPHTLQDPHYDRTLSGLYHCMRAPCTQEEAGKLEPRGVPSLVPRVRVRRAHALRYEARVPRMHASALKGSYTRGVGSVGMRRPLRRARAPMPKRHTHCLRITPRLDQRCARAPMPPTHRVPAPFWVSNEYVRSHACTSMRCCVRATHASAVRVRVA